MLGKLPENGGSKPLTLAEFTLQSNDKDFYDVTIIDGVNVFSQVLRSDDQGKLKFSFTLPQNIDKGEAILQDLYGLFKSGSKNRSKMEDLSSDFYTMIPHRLGRSRASIESGLVRQ